MPPSQIIITSRQEKCAGLSIVKVANRYSGDWFWGLISQSQGLAFLKYLHNLPAFTWKTYFIALSVRLSNEVHVDNQLSLASQVLF